MGKFGQWQFLVVKRATHVYLNLVPVPILQLCSLRVSVFQAQFVFNKSEVKHIHSFHYLVEDTDTTKASVHGIIAGSNMKINL